jgi:Peptidase S46
MSSRVRRLLSPLGLFCAAVLAACAEDPPPAVVAPPPPPPEPPETAATPAPPPRPVFENPGGMWMPDQLAAQAGTLKTLGLAIDPAALADPTAFPLGAVVSLGGCSASFVSNHGLVVTNHHCAARALQYNSTAKENLLKNGYFAKTNADEKWAGPTAHIYVTQAFRDVTHDVRDGLDAITSAAARFKTIEDREKGLVTACEKGRPQMRCSVAEYFGGAKDLLIEQLDIKDVRLVYAPADGVGDFGGETDNWRWPRHAGDFSFLRAYVGKDNLPKDHADDNVPYHPPQHLKLAEKPLQESDLVMVAGYPGTTNRLRTAAEVDEAVSWLYPRRVKAYDEFIALLDQLGKQSPDLALKGRTLWLGLFNAEIKTRGLIDGLTKGGVGAQKVELEGQLKAFIDGDPARQAAYGDVLEKMAALVAAHGKTREGDAALTDALRMSSLVNAATTIVHLAEERPKADADREPAFQERNWPRLEQEQHALQKTYDRTLDRSLFKLALERSARLSPADQSGLLGAVMGKRNGHAPTDNGAFDAGEEKKLDQALDAIYAKTKLEDEAARVDLLKTAKLADLKKSKDPLVQLALLLRPMQKAIEDRDHAYAGDMELLRPRYVEALRKLGEQKGAALPLSSDANGTLRITYGTVRGYKPSADAPAFRPFTVLSEVLKKNTGKDPFEAPANLVAAATAKKFGPYVDPVLGEVPVDFLSDLDITGGNSGSPTLNARGELVGLAFDGNYEAMASDWVFLPSITRTIHLHARYMLWVMDAVDGADRLITEMGGQPAIE